MRDIASTTVQALELGTLHMTYSPADLSFSSQFARKYQDFADFSTTGSVEFGLFSAKTSTGFGYMQTPADRVNLNGSTSAVPEPSTYGLFIGAGLAALVIARRRRAISA